MIKGHHREAILYNDFSDAVDISLTAPFEYVHLHTKIIDTASHKKDPMLKVKAIEKIDSKISKLVDFKGLLVVTADHSTPSSGRMIHSGESVPFMAMGEFVRIDRVDKYTEIDCANGSINLYGSDFINYINNARDSGKLYHLKQGKGRRNFLLKDINRLI